MAPPQPAVSGENFERNLELVGRVEEIAAKKGCKPSQLALAWVVAQGEGVVPIPGTANRVHLEENVAALELQLTPQELEQINEAMPLGAAAGDRYVEAGMKVVNG